MTAHDTHHIPPGYQRTELGVIPQDWEIRKIGERVSLGFIEKPMDGNHGNIHPKSDDFVNYGIPFIMANNVYGGKVDLKACKFITEKQASKLQKGFSYEGDVLLTHKGTVGNTAIVPKLNIPYIMLTPQVTYYRSSSAKLINQYIRFFFDGPVFQKHLEQNSGGATRAYIGITKQNDLLFIIPPPTEQTLISTALTDIDNLITSLDDLILKKQAIKQATMQQLLTDKKRLPGFDGEWEEKKLGEIVNFYKGKGLPKSALVQNGNYKCVHYGELFTKYDELIDKVRSSTNENINSFFSRSNDVLMPTSDVTPNGLATASCIKEDGVVLGGDILVIRSFENTIDGTFLSYYIAQERTQVMQLVSGTTVFHLYASDMSKFIIKYPKVEEQLKIIKILSDMDADIQYTTAQRDKYTVIKQGMMQQLLTGKIRLML